MNPERERQKIMALPKGEREIPLREFAQKLGCSLTGTQTPNGVHLEHIVIERINDAIRAWHEVRMRRLQIIGIVIAVLLGAATLIVAFFKPWISN